jgi:hypothetical protein
VPSNRRGLVVALSTTPELTVLSDRRRKIGIDRAQNTTRESAVIKFVLSGSAHRICYGSRRILRRRSEGAVARSSAVSLAAARRWNGSPSDRPAAPHRDVTGQPFVEEFRFGSAVDFAEAQPSPQHSAAQRRGPPASTCSINSSRVIPAAAARPRYAPDIDAAPTTSAVVRPARLIS